jgi:hypothetical protein
MSAALPTHEDHQNGVCKGRNYCLLCAVAGYEDKQLTPYDHRLTLGAVVLVLCFGVYMVGHIVHAVTR